MKGIDPYTRMQRQQLSTLGLTILLLTVVAIFQVVNPRNDLSIKVISLVPYIILLVLGVFTILRYGSNLKHLDQRRERALQGDSSLLAAEQPLPDPNMLPIPTTIKLDQSRRSVVFLVLAIAFILFIPVVIGIVDGSGQSHLSPSNHALLLTALIILGGAVVALLVALVLIFFLMRGQLIFTIVVDERGLSSTYQGITSSINWSDARLFAVLNPEKPSTMRFYELSNEHTVVRWVNMPARLLFRRGENMAHAEYRRKVQALLSFIVARTGLPLYDLSPSSRAPC
ncbi:MAG TPA: hypothetical protein VF043_37735 [Ktedonobacteraceae bacterium]